MTMITFASQPGSPMRAHRFPSPFVPRLLAFAALLVTLAGCGSAGAEDGDGSAASAPPGVQHIALIDISGSRTARQLREMRAVLDQIVARIGPGDQLVLMEVFASAQGDAFSFSEDVPRARSAAKPTPSELKRVEGVRRGAEVFLEEVFSPERAGKVNGTDLFYTLQRAGEYRQAARGRRTVLYVLSDMLQSAGGVNMERAGGIPGADWVARQEKEGLLPGLAGSCVVVIGAEPARRDAAWVRGFWVEYFGRAGAGLRGENYRELGPDVGVLGCD